VEGGNPPYGARPLVEDAAELAAAIARAPSRQPGSALGGERLIAAVRRELVPPGARGAS
jgi:hypothetical protein